MAVTLTVNTDHTASLSSRYLARQGEVGALMTVTVPSAVYALGTYAYIDFTDADGVASYLGDYDASSGTFVVSVGAADNILAKDGIVKIQFVLRDNLISESYTAVWKSQIVEAIVERSVNADTYAIPAAMPSDDPPDTYEASRVSIEDVGTYYASNNVEDALQEAAVDIASNTGRLDAIEAAAPACQAYKSSSQSIPDSTLTTITLDAIRYDPYNLRGSSKITIADAGTYVIAASVQFASNATGIRSMRIMLNGSTIIGMIQVPPNSAGTTVLSTSCVNNLSATDEITLVVYQTSGGSLDVQYTAAVSPNLSVVRIG